MRKPDLIKAIFWELRAAGVEGSAKELLRAAHFFLRSHAGEVVSPDAFGRIVDSRALPLLPVDVVMSDGGWRLLEFELRRSSNREVDAVDAYSASARLKKILGSQWQL